MLTLQMQADERLSQSQGSLASLQERLFLAASARRLRRLLHCWRTRGRTKAVMRRQVRSSEQRKTRHVASPV